jgi:Mg2+ and Co2+ transporter CorA
MTQKFRRLATAAEDMQKDIDRLQKKVLDQRKALRGLSRAHERLWLAIRTMNPSKEAQDKLADERRQLREDFGLMKSAFRERKEVLKLKGLPPEVLPLPKNPMLSQTGAVMAFCEEDGSES